GEVLVDTGHDPEHRALAGPVGSQDADLRPGIEAQPDALEDLLALRGDLPQVLHREDVLGSHETAILSRNLTTRGGFLEPRHGHVRITVRKRDTHGFPRHVARGAGFPRDPAPPPDQAGPGARPVALPPDRPRLQGRFRGGLRGRRARLPAALLGSRARPRPPLRGHAGGARTAASRAADRRGPVAPDPVGFGLPVAFAPIRITITEL